MIVSFFTAALAFYCSSPAKQDTSPSSIFPPFISPSAPSISPAPTAAPHLFPLGLRPHPSAPANSCCCVKNQFGSFGYPWTAFSDFSLVTIRFFFFRRLTFHLILRWKLQLLQQTVHACTGVFHIISSAQTLFHKSSQADRARLVVSPCYQLS